MAFAASTNRRRHSNAHHASRPMRSSVNANTLAFLSLLVVGLWPFYIFDSSAIYDSGVTIAAPSDLVQLDNSRLDNKTFSRGNNMHIIESSRSENEMQSLGHPQLQQAKGPERFQCRAGETTPVFTAEYFNTNCGNTYFSGEIIVKGERHSGTHWVTDIIQSNLRKRVPETPLPSAVNNTRVARRRLLDGSVKGGGAKVHNTVLPPRINVANANLKKRVADLRKEAKVQPQTKSSLANAKVPNKITQLQNKVTHQSPARLVNARTVTHEHYGWKHGFYPPRGTATKVFPENTMRVVGEILYDNALSNY